MYLNTELFITSALLGVGLAMDAFSVSIANGLADRNMTTGRSLGIAGTFAAFQFAMPLIGWFLVTRAAEKFEWFRPLIPWIALILLLIIGIGLLRDGAKELKSGSDPDANAETGDETSAKSKASSGTNGTKLSFAALMMQGVATSIDALSVGFTTASYNAAQAAVSSLIIGVVTLVICLAGLRLGKKLGEMLAGRASILGGLILIAIGLEIWIKGVFF